MERSLTPMEGGFLPMTDSEIEALIQEPNEYNSNKILKADPELEMSGHKIDDMLVCQICSLVLIEPKECIQCEQSFCSDCIENWIQKKVECPNCREKFQGKQPHRSIKNQLDNLIFRCPNNCSVQKINYQDFSKHLQLCFVLECPMKCTSIRFNSRSDIFNHLKSECPLSVLKCVRCGGLIPNSEREKHDCIAQFQLNLEKLHIKIDDKDAVISKLQNQVENLEQKLNDSIVQQEKFKDLESKLQILTQEKELVQNLLNQLQRENSVEIEQLKKDKLNLESLALNFQKQYESESKISKILKQEKEEFKLRIQDLQQQFDDLSFNNALLYQNMQEKEEEKVNVQPIKSSTEQQPSPARTRQPKFGFTEIQVLQLIAEEGLKKLVDDLKKEEIIKSDLVYGVMLKIDRKNFMISQREAQAYENSPQPIGYNTTISAPSIHAYTLEALKFHLENSKKVIDIGTGSGYLAACFAELVPEDGVVVMLDHIPGLIEQAQGNLLLRNQVLFETGKIKAVVKDGRNGCAEEGPYDVIHVGGAVEVIPQCLLDQLAPGGRMWIPAGPKGSQKIYIADKDALGNVKKNEIMQVIYGPLTSVEEQLSDK